MGAKINDYILQPMKELLNAINHSLFRMDFMHTRPDQILSHSSLF